MPGQPMNLSFPVKGLSRNNPYAMPPEGTTPAAQNVRPEDAIDHRFRGGRRGGLVKQNASRVANSAIQHLTVGTTVTDPGSGNDFRVTRVNQAAGGETHFSSLLVGDDDGGSVVDTQVAPDTMTESRVRWCCYDNYGSLYVFQYNAVYKYNASLAAQGYVQVTTDDAVDVFGLLYCPAWDRIAVFMKGNSSWLGAGATNAALLLIDPTTMTITANHDLGVDANLGYRSADAHPLVWDSTNENLILVCKRTTTTYGGGVGGVAKNVFAFDSSLTVQWSADTGAGTYNAYGGGVYGGVLYTIQRNTGAAKAQIHQITAVDGTLIRSDDVPDIDGHAPDCSADSTTSNCVIRSDGKLVMMSGCASSAAPREYWGAITCLAWNAGTSVWDVEWYYYKDETIDVVNAIPPRGSVYLDSDDEVYFSGPCDGATSGSTWENAADGISDYVTVINFSSLGVYEWYWDENGPSASWDIGNYGGEYSGRGFAIYEAAGNTDERPFSTVDYVFVQDGVVYDSDNVAFTYGTNTLKTRVNDIQSAWAYQNIYFVDGVNSRILVLLQTDASPWSTYYRQVIDWPTLVTSDGEGTMPEDCRLICRYRGRIVLSGRGSDPHNWYMSAVNDPLDWDYAPAILSATQAVAGTNADAGKVGDAITALIPFNDDLLIFGGVHSIYQCSGDPADNGTIDLLTDKTGIRLGDAYCRDPQGRIYFLGTDGVYQLSAEAGSGSQIASITAGRLDNEFDSIDFSAYRAHMVWDYQRAGLFLTFVPYDSTSSILVYFWGKQTDSWWVDSYPATMGPTTMVAMTGETPADARLLFGGLDGYIRYYSDTAETDDATAITSYVDWILPAMPLDTRYALKEIQPVLGESSAAVTLQVYRGTTAQEATNAATPVLVRTLTAGRSLPVIHSVSGRHLRLRVTSVGNRWALEQLQLQFSGVGKGRKR